MKNQTLSFKRLKIGIIRTLDKCRIQAIRELHIRAMIKTGFRKYLELLEVTHARFGDLEGALQSKILRHMKLVLSSYLS